MERAALWILGGPNGAGKTTLASHQRFQRLLHGVVFLNPDQLALERLRAAGRQGCHDATPAELRHCFIESGQAVERELRAALTRRELIGVESVLRTKKYYPLVEQVIADGGFFGLIYIALKSPKISRQRVARRVAQGGHNVPLEKLAARWTKSIENLRWFAPRASQLWVLDNSDSTPDVPPRLIAKGGGGAV